MKDAIKWNKSVRILWQDFTSRETKRCAPFFPKLNTFGQNWSLFQKLTKRVRTCSFLHKHGYFGSDQEKHRKVVRITHIDPYWPCIVITFLCIFRNDRNDRNEQKVAFLKKVKKVKIVKIRNFEKCQKWQKWKKCRASTFLSDRSTFVTFDQVVQLFSKRLHSYVIT